MILVTGATGFVGKELISQLLAHQKSVRACVRQSSASFPDSVDIAQTGNLSPELDWTPFLVGVEAVVHAAARVHVMQDSLSDPLVEYRKVNTEATLNLARQAAKAGVKRFIFISSIKVNGESTAPGTPFSPETTPHPVDPYGVSKYEAEQGLLELAAQSDLEVVIIRPPLVYGPGVKANFRSMIKWLHRGVPLPLGGIHNQRSLVALDNLVNFIELCLTHAKAKNQVFLISDQQDVSTTGLLQAISKALGKPSLLIPIPMTLIKLAAGVLGKQGLEQRLAGSLQVDSSKATERLDWRPVVTFEQGVQKTVDAYLG